MQFTARPGKLTELNGATAHLGKIGDRVTIMSFARYTPQEAVTRRPRIVLLNEDNEVVRYDAGTCTRAFKIVGE
jgi:aspartate 1-decarboxylase